MAHNTGGRRGGGCGPLLVGAHDVISHREAVRNFPYPPNELVVWHAFGGTYKELFEKSVAGFEKAHPGVHVRLVYTPNDTSTDQNDNQKFFTAVAAKKTPDVTCVDGPQVAEWAELGALQPLDKFAQKSRIKPSDFFTPCWKQCSYDGQTWALSIFADPNLAFGWNKDSFRKAGLNPNKPPETRDELDRMAKKLTKIENGTLKTIAIIPWNKYGAANSMFTWGWAFGGSFYDEKHHKVTANDPKNVKAGRNELLPYRQRGRCKSLRAQAGLRTQLYADPRRRTIRVRFNVL